MIRNEESLRQLKSDLKKLGEEQVDSGVKSKQLTKLRELLDQKISRTDNQSESQLIEEIDAAKTKNAELTEKLKQKRQELNSMMIKRKSEIETLSKQLSESKESSAEEAEDAGSEKSGSVLKGADIKMSSLQNSISAELKEKQRLMQQIEKLESNKSEKSNIAEGSTKPQKSRASDSDLIDPRELSDAKSSQRFPNLSHENKAEMSERNSSTNGEPSITSASSYGKFSGVSKSNVKSPINQELDGEESSAIDEKSSRLGSEENEITFEKSEEQVHSRQVSKAPKEETDRSSVVDLNDLPLTSSKESKGGDPLGSIINMIKEKEKQIDKMHDSNNRVGQDGIDLDHLKREVETLRGSLPKGYEKKSAIYKHLAAPPDNSKLHGKGKRTEISAGSDQIRLVGVNVNKIIRYENEPSSSPESKALSVQSESRQTPSIESQYGSSE